MFIFMVMICVNEYILKKSASMYLSFFFTNFPAEELYILAYIQHLLKTLRDTKNGCSFVVNKVFLQIGDVVQDVCNKFRKAVYVCIFYLQISPPSSYSMSINNNMHAHTTNTEIRKSLVVPFQIYTSEKVL